MKAASLALAAAATLSLSPLAQAADGKAVYDATCVVCHASGVANAPKLGDKEGWGPRMATGKAALLKSVQTGKGAMPPKAGNANLSDADIMAAIDYMLASVK
jgi:cytochrome c5